MSHSLKGQGLFAAQNPEKGARPWKFLKGEEKDCGTDVLVVAVLGGKPILGTGSGKLRGSFPATSAGSRDAGS